MPDRAHDPAVEPAQGLLGHRGKCVPVRVMPGLADWEFRPVDKEPGAPGRLLHHLHAFRNDLEADVIAQKNRDLQRHHSSTTMPSSSTILLQPAISRCSQACESPSEACAV